MIKKLIPAVIFAALIMVTGACDSKKKPASATKNDTAMQQKLDEFATVKLTTDLSKLSVKEKQMIPILIEVAQTDGDIFWEPTLGNKQVSSTASRTKLHAALPKSIRSWERLGNNAPFISSFGEKPKGANFYPADMTKEEFEKFGDKNKTSQYTLIRRNDDKSLKCVWYHEAYKEKTQKAAALLQKAALLAEDPGLKNYLNLRAQALLTDDYFASDMAWMDMKNNTLDFVVGPIENYEDELFGYKTAHEAALLVKDKDWSLKLAKYSAMLPELQTQLPVDAKYKKEKPGSNSDLNAYDIIYYAGNSNCGGKTIAINLPNDEKVQLKKGSRRLQLKNAMKAKFDNILQPIAKVLCDPSQLKNITFDAFFSNVMFHEVAHGLGIKNTVTGKGTVRTALKEKFSAFEEAKADILGLFMVSKLIEKGDLKNISVDDAYVTYMMGIIRSVRFGAGDAHGKANMMCFNFFEDKGAFTRNADGTYKVDMVKTKKAADEWSALILKFEGEGDYAGASKYLEANSIVRPALKSDIGKLKTANIPVDVVFEQGVKTLGL